MIFRSPSSDNTKPLETDGSFVIFWRKWFAAVAQWLLEASRTNQAAGVPWVQHGQIVFISYAGDGIVIIPVGFSKGCIPPPASDANLIEDNAGSVTIKPLTTASIELVLTAPTSGWYIAKEAER